MSGSNRARSNLPAISRSCFSVPALWEVMLSIKKAIFIGAKRGVSYAAYGSLRKSSMHTDHEEILEQTFVWSKGERPLTDRHGKIRARFFQIQSSEV